MNNCTIAMQNRSARERSVSMQCKTARTGGALFTREIGVGVTTFSNMATTKEEIFSSITNPHGRYLMQHRE